MKPGSKNGQQVTARRPSREEELAREAVPVPRLQKTPHAGHKPESYEDMEDLEYPALLYSVMEQHLPSNCLGASREKKLAMLERVLAKYRPNGERAKKHQEYRERIRTNYQPLHEDLYSFAPERFFVGSFLDAIKDGSEAALRHILIAHSPGVFTFNMLKPGFCSMMLEEVEHFEKWAQDAKVKVMRPNTMNNYGAVLDDIGMEDMLNELMTSYLNPMAAVLFPNVGGSSLDSHHGFVVEYAMDRDLDLGFHVDDSEVTLNVCLGKQFDSGELFFRGVRCDKHVNGEARPEEVLEYSHVPGHAILHAGRHRHGAKAITSGQRTNMILWCRSSEFRELKKYQRDFSSWCGECLLRKKERSRCLSSAKRQLAS
ncbi:unnamed protein product [Sphagnum troendelagicum]|uniref:Fe2OG dioxygenase domain-containing protein n=1 Tax=Sphagnum troendelagicum TaxID=128251 RepID=A0ABP0THV6_9BRYO